MTDNSYPRYSPDGSLVVYQCRRHEGEKVLYTARVVDREGKAPKEIINFHQEFSVRPNGPPAWSPDGKETVWACVRQSMDGRIEDFPLVFVSPDGRRKRLVKTDSLNAVIFPDWR